MFKFILQSMTHFLEMSFSFSPLIIWCELKLEGEWQMESHLCGLEVQSCVLQRAGCTWELLGVSYGIPLKYDASLS